MINYKQLPIAIIILCSCGPMADSNTTTQSTSLETIDTLGSANNEQNANLNQPHAIFGSCPECAFDQKRDITFVFEEIKESKKDRWASHSALSISFINFTPVKTTDSPNVCITPFHSSLNHVGLPDESLTSLYDDFFTAWVVELRDNQIIIAYDAMYSDKPEDFDTLNFNMNRQSGYLEAHNLTLGSFHKEGGFSLTPAATFDGCGEEEEPSESNDSKSTVKTIIQNTL